MRKNLLSRTRLIAMLVAGIPLAGAWWGDSFAAAPEAAFAPDSPSNSNAPSTRGGEQRGFTVPLVIASTTGCVAKGPAVTLLDRVVAQESDVIIVEAEDAASIAFAPDALARSRSRPGGAAPAGNQGVEQVYGRDLQAYGPQEGAGASGKFIDYVSSARWIVNITKPGGYAVWYRYWVPSSGRWTHVDEKDREGALPLLLHPSGQEPKPGQWYWVIGHPSYYKSGPVTLSVSSMTDGQRLDRLAIVPQNIGFNPEGIGPPATPARPLKEGSVIYQPLRPPGLVKWELLEFERGESGEPGKAGDPGGVGDSGGAGVDVSTDGGKSWKAINDRLVLSAIAPQNASELTVRLRLTRSGAAAPVVSGVRCRYVAKASEFLAIQNEFTRMTFSRRDGALCGIENLKTGAALTPSGLPGPTFSLGLRRPDGPQRVQMLANPAVKYDIPGIIRVPFSEAKLISIDCDGRKLDAQWSVREVRLRLEVVLRDSPLATWTISLTNENHELDVVDVTSPVIAHLRIGDSSDDDRCAWPYQAGDLLVNPAALGERTLDAGHMGLGFADLFDASGGFYLGNHNPLPIVTELASRPDSGGDRLELSFSKLDRIKAGGGSATYEYALGPHPGDWHWGADQYRAFFLAAHPFPADAFPAWLRETDAWYVGSLGLPISGAAQRHYDELRGLRVTPLLLGLRYLQIWGSTFNEACPDYYLPRNECGGAEALARNMADWQSIGGIAGHYLHGNGIGTAYAYAERYFDRPWSDYPPADRAPDEAFHRRNEVFPSHKFRPDYASWPLIQRQFEQGLNSQRRGNSWLPDPTRVAADYHRMSWQGGALAAFLTKWTDRYVREYRSTTIYYDTLPFAATPEFNPYLDCNGEGSVTVNRVKFLREAVASMRGVHPDFAAIVEGASDVFSPWSASLISGFSRHPEIFRYTLPQAVIFEGQSNANWTEDASRASLASAFIHGHRLDLLRMYPHAREILRLRQRLSPWFNDATFVDTDGLEVDRDRVQARVHRVDRPDARGVLIAVHNPQHLRDVLIRYTLPEGMRVNANHCFQQGQDRPVRLNFKQDANTLSFVAPDALTSGVVLVDEAAGPLAWTAIPHQSDSNAIALDLYSFATEPIRITATVTGQHVAFHDGQRTIDLKPGEPITAGFTAKASSSDPWIEPVTIKLSGAGHERTQLCGIAKPAPNGSVEASFQTQTTDQVAFDGKRSHIGVPGTYHDNPLALVPGKTYRLTVAIRGKPRGLNVYYSGDGKAVGGKSNTLTLARFDKGWDIYETVVTAGLANALYLYSGQATELYYYDAIRADAVRPGSGRPAGR